MNIETTIVLKGVIAIVTLRNGDALASKSDFERSGYGGFQLCEAQAMRARTEVIREAVSAIVGPTLAQWLSDYTMDYIWKDMRDNGGARITLIPIGWDGDDALTAMSRSEKR